MTSSARVLERLEPSEALALLSGVPFGRFIFSDGGPPTVRLLNHLVEAGSVIVRTHAGAAIDGAVQGAGLNVTYQADRLDERDRLGWTVTVTGRATVITDEASARRYKALLRPWLDKTNDVVIAIAPASVTGSRIIAPAKEA